MSIQTSPFFSIQDVRRAWDDAATRIVPLMSLTPTGKEQVREYFIELLVGQATGNNDFPKDPGQTEVDPADKNTSEDKEQ